MDNYRVLKDFINYFEPYAAESQPGLDVEEILNFEKFNRVKLPETLKKFYLKMNGTCDDTKSAQDWSDVSSDGYRIYPLRGENLVGSTYFIFCEWVVGLNQYAINLSADQANEDVIHLINGNSGNVIAKNFLGFAELFLSKSDLLLNASSCPEIQLNAAG